LTEFLVVGDDGREVVGIAIVLFQEEPTVFLLVVAEVADGHANYLIRLRNLEAVGIAIVWGVE
jgi:hypothetical protein